MRKKSSRKKKEESKRRFEAIKDLMSTFAMTTVAVVATVTLIPASPKAEIIKSVALSEEIVYQVNVTDEDNALDLDTLFVVLENQFEYYEQPISLGENSGYFDSLETNTQYRLSVYGNKGFGQERLDTLKLTTDDKAGGTILAVTEEKIDFSTTYTVDVSINDPNSEYISVNLYYGYSWEHEEEIFYSSVPVTSSNMSIELTDIFTEGAFHIYLEATTADGAIVLDEIWVTPAFEFYTSVSMNYIDSKEVGFFIYDDMRVENVEYVMNVYKNDFLIGSNEVIKQEGEFHGTEFVIDELSPNTTYVFECLAIYTNPQTLREERDVVYEEEITTLGGYSYTYTKEEFEEFYEITITLDDPSHNFQAVAVKGWDTSEEFEVFIFFETYFFIQDGEEKSSSFTILVPATTAYLIKIELRNETNNLIKHDLDIIIFEMEE